MHSSSFAAYAALFSLIIPPAIDACTGLKLTAQDGSVVHGRTLEFGVPIESSVVVIPRNYEFQGTTPQGSGLSYKSKYAAVGIIAFNDPAIMDGMNEKGLAVGTFYFPGFAQYSSVNQANQSKALSPVEFPNWILTQFGTLEELRQHIHEAVIVPTITPSWGDAPAPFHYIVYDRKGDALVIEPLEGQLVLHDNPLGVFTNSPTFDWYLTHLRNFIHLTSVNAAPITLNGVELKPLGQGSGLVGLPGDFTPPSRFVRAAVFASTALAPKSSEEGIFQLFHILNQFDIPAGAVKQVSPKRVESDTTLATSVKDPASLKYYFKTYPDQNIKYVDLNQFDLNGPSIKIASTEGREKARNVSDQLQPFPLNR